MKRLLLTVITLAILATAMIAQTNDFTYQGSLINAGVPATGTYDFEFRLFDTDNGGAQVGATATRTGVTVTDGVFNVSLSFTGGFPGADRWLEISIRSAGSGGGYQQLLPRVKIGSSPYAVKSQTAETAGNATTANNALSLGGVAANQYVQTTDPRMTDARPPTVGSNSYIQNQSAAPQAATDFNISGNGRAGGTLTGNVVNAATQFNIGSEHVLSNPGIANLFAGFNAGNANVTGNSNAFFGSRAGQAITFGNANSFFGTRAGLENTSGSGNSFFGRLAGGLNTSGSSNAFFGFETGSSNTTANANSFFGFFSGGRNTTGFGNTFLGASAGTLNVTGSRNTIVGYQAEVGANDLTFATAIGSEAVVSNSNSIVLGRPGGEDTVRIPGPTSLSGNLVVGSGNIILFQSPVALSALGTSGGSSLCRNGSSQIALCSSSLRYKSGIKKFASGLQLIDRLRPITFEWIDGQPRDLGLGAEDVAAIEPLLVTYNEKGEVEGVKYDRIGVVLVNVVKEQQSQIEALKTQIEEQRAITESLRQLVCAQNASAAVCSPK